MQTESTQTEEHRAMDAGAEVSSMMASRGFVSVFDHAKPAIAGQTVWTLWVNMRQGSQALTMVGPQGEIVVYDVIERPDARGEEENGYPSFSDGGMPLG